METAAVETIVPDEQAAEPVAPEPDSSAVDWQVVRDQINEDPPTLIFEAYQTEASLSHDGADKFGVIMDYLDNNPDGSLLVTGHTDISGSRSLNMELSQGRAEFLKSLLVQHGIEEEKITTTYKGPDDPIADNSSPEGRAINRRAVVIIK
jgi:outer membrane protein OmpA-like peptidoglycan-associated protein